MTVNTIVSDRVCNIHIPRASFALKGNRGVPTCAVLLPRGAKPWRFRYWRYRERPKGFVVAISPWRPAKMKIVGGRLIVPCANLAPNDVTAPERDGQVLAIDLQVKVSR